LAKQWKTDLAILILDAESSGIMQADIILKEADFGTLWLVGELITAINVQLIFYACDYKKP